MTGFKVGQYGLRRKIDGLSPTCSQPFEHISLSLAGLPCRRHVRPESLRVPSDGRSLLSIALSVSYASTMEASAFFLQLAIILISARFAAEVASRFGAPSVIGELLAGVVLGPSLLGWIEVTEVIRLLAEIGIILLLLKVF